MLYLYRALCKSPKHYHLFKRKFCCGCLFYAFCIIKSVKKEEKKTTENATEKYSSKEFVEKIIIVQFPNKTMQRYPPPSPIFKCFHIKY